MKRCKMLKSIVRYGAEWWDGGVWLVRYDLFWISSLIGHFTGHNSQTPPTARVVFGITKISRKFQENFKKNYIPQEGRHLHQHENIICTTK